MSDRPTYTIQLRPEPKVDGPRALRAFLKAALRRYGLRCLTVRQSDDEGTNDRR